MNHFSAAFRMFAMLLVLTTMLACPSLAAPPAPLAELVSYSADRVPLNALLWAPPGPTKSIAVLVPGFYGNMIGGHDYTPMAREMSARGYAFMTINMRTASDFTDPRLEDAIPDIRAAVNFAKSRGYEQIVLMGTSLGGPRSMLYMAEAKDPAIVAYVLLAAIMSPYEEAQLRMDEAHRQRHDALLEKARAMVAAGRASGMVVYDDWFKGRAVRMTARGYLTYSETVRIRRSARRSAARK